MKERQINLNMKNTLTITLMTEDQIQEILIQEIQIQEWQMINTVKI